MSNRDGRWALNGVVGVGRRCMGPGPWTEGEDREGEASERTTMLSSRSGIERERERKVRGKSSSKQTTAVGRSGSYDEELMLALITDRRSRLRRSGVIRHGLQRSNVDPMPSGTDTNGHATASLTYAALVKDAYSQVPRGITKTRNSSVPPPTLPTEGKHSPSHRPRIPSMDNSSERALAR